MRLSGLRVPPLSSSHAMSWVGMMFVKAVVIALACIVSDRPSTCEREVRCCLRCARFLWRAEKVALERTRRARLQNLQCAHTGTLEPRVGHRLHRFPLCKLSCLIMGDQRCPPLAQPFPLSFGGLTVWVLGRVVSLPPIFVIYTWQASMQCQSDC